MPTETQTDDSDLLDFASLHTLPGVPHADNDGPSERNVAEGRRPSASKVAARDPSRDRVPAVEVHHGSGRVKI